MASAHLNSALTERHQFALYIKVVYRCSVVFDYVSQVTIINMSNFRNRNFTIIPFQRQIFSDNSIHQSHSGQHTIVKSINCTESQFIYSVRLEMEIRSSVAPWTQKIKRNANCLLQSTPAKNVVWCKKEIFMHCASEWQQLSNQKNGFLFFLVRFSVRTDVSWNSIHLHTFTETLK